MKSLFRLFVFWAIPVTATAQMRQSSFAAALHDSLRAATNDTLRMLAFGKLQGYYGGRNIDSTLFYLDQAISTAKKINQPLWQGRYSVIKAYYLQSIYNFSLSFRLCNEAMAIAGDRGNEKNVYAPWGSDGVEQDPARFRKELNISAYHQLGSTYFAAGNKEKAIEYYRKAIQMANEIRDTPFLVNPHRYIGEIYGELGILDSSLLYTKKALEYARLKRRNFIPPIMISMGYTFLKRGSLDSAEWYFRQSISELGNVTKVSGLAPGFLALADLFEKLEKPDSVLHYAMAAYMYGKEMNNAHVLRSSSEKIAWAWKRLGNPDSALSYIYISKNIGDSLNKQRTENLIRFQNTAFEEQLKLEKQAQESIRYKNKIRTIGFGAALAVLSLLAFIFYRNNRQKHKANAVLQNTLHELKATQTQLVHAEKMASLGELTAGIAHEIQNPLNFVNNFSEVSKELIDEVKSERAKVKSERDEGLEEELLEDIAQNLDKIHHHGKRADAIVKSMLAHSRTASGKMEPTDLNTLAEEYLRLSYHAHLNNYVGQGLKAKDPPFDATILFEPDKNLPKIPLVPQDIGRVLLNLLNNAFYAVGQRSKKEGAVYTPKVLLRTEMQGKFVAITVQDNGGGIPEHLKEKIFQPFFTTKPTGEGTGLGLSLSYDIITKGHKGKCEVFSVEGSGATFTFFLPLLPDN